MFVSDDQSSRLHEILVKMPSYLVLIIKKEAPIIIPRYFNCLTSGLPVDSTVFRIVSFRRSANLAQFILYPEILPKLAKIVKMLCMDCNALPKLKWTSSAFI